MTALVRLYPQAWRDRYEDEFLDLLEARPPGIRDRLDILVGAVDARLHDEVPGSARGHGLPRLRLQTGIGLLLVVSGAAWLVWSSIILVYFRGWGAGMPEHADVGMAAAFVAGAGLAASHLAVLSMPGRAVGGWTGGAAWVAAAMFLLTAFGAGILAPVALVASAATAMGLAGRLLPGPIAVAWAATAVLTIGAMAAFLASDGRDVGVLVAMVPFGIVLLIAGPALALRRPAPARTGTDLRG